MISLKHIYKTYSVDHHVLKNLSLTLKNGDLAFLTGPSGAGKTTLFKIIAGLDKATSGQVLFNNVNLNELSPGQIAEYRQKLGIVFQDSKLIPKLTVAENIGLPLKIQHLTKKEIDDRVKHALTELKLENLSASYPDHLSGGQQQRISLLRATIHNPKIIIADEPTGNLDKENETVVIKYLSKKAQDGACVLIATHNFDVVKKFATRHLTLNQGEVQENNAL